MEVTTSLPPVISSNDLVEQDPGSDPLFRASSFPSGSSDQQWRRRTSSLLARPTRQKSFGREVGHAAAETYLITRLSFKLLSCLGLPMDHETPFSCPLCHVSFAWISPRLDLYLPKNSDGLKPMVIFVTGGAWIIGYKAWGSLLGLQLAERDIIVASIDYRNFPQGTISDMVNDISQGISYVCNNVVEFGGDPNKIYLMGQSAGAHISACTLLQQAVKESKGDCISWSVSQIRAYFGLSGGYNLLKLVDHFHGRGLYRSIFLSKTFADTLRKAGAQAELILYNGKTHADLFLQDPLRGGKDELFDYVLTFIHSDDKEALASDAMASPRRRFVPEILLRLAREVSPF